MHELTVHITYLRGAGGIIAQETQNIREMFNLSLHKNGKKKKNPSGFVMEISKSFTLLRYHVKPLSPKAMSVQSSLPRANTTEGNAHKKICIQ